MTWWRIEHRLEYHHDEIITEASYVEAEDVNEAIAILGSHTAISRIFRNLEKISFQKVDESEIGDGRVIDLTDSQERGFRDQLVWMALQWERHFGIAPSITTAISEYDAAVLVGCGMEEFRRNGKEIAAVNKGWDFKHGGIRYQVKACRPSGKKGSKITNVPKARNYDWDKLVWIRYDENFEIVAHSIWDRDKYISAFAGKKRISPQDIESVKGA